MREGACSLECRVRLLDIDRDAPATDEGQLQIAAAPETVWAVISDVAAWPSWNPAMKKVSIEGPLVPGTVFRWKSGSASLVSTLKVVDALKIGWTGASMGIKAAHVFRFEAKDGGTSARSEESWRGMIASLLKGYSRKTMQRAIDGTLASLKTEAERRAVA